MFSRKQLMQSMPTPSSSSQTFLQKVTSVFSNMNWITTSLLVLFIAVMIYLSYYLYNQFAGTKTAFTPNSPQQMPEKTAELLLFHTEWCPHCKKAMPDWKSLKSEYEGKQINGYKLVFTEHNCTNESEEIEELLEKYKIEGYPTIKLLKDNQIIEYDAKPTKSTILQFLNTVL